MLSFEFNIVVISVMKWQQMMQKILFVDFSLYLRLCCAMQQHCVQGSAVVEKESMPSAQRKKNVYKNENLEKNRLRDKQ